MLRALTATCLTLGLAAQDVRLCERVEGPMLYVSIDAGAANAATGGRSPLLALLASTPAASFDGSATAGAVGFLRGVLARATGEVELALLGVAPAGLTGGGGDAVGMPLVVVRTRLSNADAVRLRTVLADPQVATPLRTVHGHPTWALRGADHSAGGPDAPDTADAPDRPSAPAFAVEAAVVGDDLVVANHGRGIEQALDGATSGRRTLAGDERYRRLVAQLRPAAGALVVFADWQRFGPRLASVGGLPGELLAWSGLGGADAIAAAVTPHAGLPGALQSVVLMSFPAAAPDGWLGLVEPVPARQLVDEVPIGGLGGCVFAVEPRRLGGVATRAPGFDARLRGGCGAAGIDIDRVTRRLGQRGALQLLLAGAGADVVPAFALQAQGRKNAAEIVDEVRRAFGDTTAQRGDHAAGVELRNVGRLERLRLEAVEDWLVFSQRAEAAPAIVAARRERVRARPQVEAAFEKALRAFAIERGDRLAGVLHVDAAALAALVGSPPEARSMPADGWPSRHTGLLDFAADRDVPGTVLRLQLLSTR